MKKLYTFCLGLLTVSAVAQVPTNLGSNAEDGFTYVNYPLIDHGVVSSYRFMAQNSIPAGDGTWEFFTDNYNFSWRPYFADDTLSSYNAIIDPAVETASARYNANGGQTGKLPAVQAGYYYTAIVQDGGGDNLMSIIETDFNPVTINTIDHSPADPLVTDNITITVTLLNALTLSAGEHVFVRASVDGYTSSIFTEITNFSNGTGSITIPAGTIPTGTTVNYYVLVTAEASPVHETIDYFTLFFGNNSGSNYEFTVSQVTGIEDAISEFGIVNSNGNIRIANTSGLNRIELIGLDGKMVVSQAVNGAIVNLNTETLAKGVHALNLIGADVRSSVKLFID
jgi:hypothetical protein